MDSALILVINCGSSSVKFAVIDPLHQRIQMQGLAQQLNTPQANFSYDFQQQSRSIGLTAGQHQDAIAAILQALEDHTLTPQLQAVGHRVVHGAEIFTASTLMDDNKLAQLKELSHLAPLHNPQNILGIELMQQALPSLPQVAVFDTSFHQSLNESAYLYALPYELYRDHGVRRYGFHGTSFRYISQHFAEQNPEARQILVAHLGNGCSACAIKDGQSVDTTMGLTPLAGLPMGSRCGDLDPGLMTYLTERLNCSAQQVLDIYNQKSGLLGLSGISNDMRELQAAAREGNIRANLAIEVFAFQIARQLSALAVSLERIDALIFTGGIGENDPLTRSLILEHLNIFGFEMDGTSNQHNGDQQGRISGQNSTPCYVIATNEELMIALDAHALSGQSFPNPKADR